MIIEVCQSILELEFFLDKKDDMFENNADSIISKIGESGYRFHFNSGKIYSSFGIDDSSKVKLFMRMRVDKQYIVSTDIIIQKS